MSPNHETFLKHLVGLGQKISFINTIDLQIKSLEILPKSQTAQYEQFTITALVTRIQDLHIPTYCGRLALFMALVGSV